MPVRHSVQNFQRCGAFIAAFPIDRWKMAIWKNSTRRWESITNMFLAPLPFLVRCKTKGAAGAVCTLGNKNPIAKYCTRWRGTFKGLSQNWGPAHFSKTSAPLSSTKTYRMNLISAGSISLDSTFKHSRSSAPYFTMWTNTVQGT